MFLFRTRIGKIVWFHAFDLTFVLISSEIHHFLKCTCTYMHMQAAVKDIKAKRDKKAAEGTTQKAATA